MNRRSRHFVVLAVAVVTAAVASFAMYRVVLVRSANAQERPNQRVVVAKHTMAIGTQVTEADVKVVWWPVNSPLANAIGDIKDVVNRGLLTTVLENEPITSNKIAAAGAGLSPAIPAGMRAMAVKVNDVIGVAGFVVPKSRVDVVVTIRRQSDSMARTAASNVEVLAAGTRQDQGKSETDSKTQNASTVVTLMVSPQDAERIALAQAEGEIMLMLRNPSDNETAQTTGVKTDQLLGLPEPAAAPVVRTAPPPRRITTPQVTENKTEKTKPEPYTVEAIRGQKRTSEEVKDAKSAAEQKSGSEDKE
jgi:pilus assembly protein CpaB